VFLADDGWRRAAGRARLAWYIRTAPPLPCIHLAQSKLKPFLPPLHNLQSLGHSASAPQETLRLQASDKDVNLFHGPSTTVPSDARLNTGCARANGSAGCCGRTLVCAPIRGGRRWPVRLQADRARMCSAAPEKDNNSLAIRRWMRIRGGRPLRISRGLAGRIWDAGLLALGVLCATVCGRSLTRAVTACSGRALILTVFTST